jgi:hypothetical protein
MNKDRLYVRRFALVLTTFFAMVLGSAFASPALAGGSSQNNVQLNISGGNAVALSTCLNYAQTMAKHKKAPQSNKCKNFAKAQGGDVRLKKVTIEVIQVGGSKESYNNVEINITGGDAVAVAACVNYLQGTATADQTNKCANKAKAEGGDVTLKNVSIVIIQE